MKKPLYTRIFVLIALLAALLCLPACSTIVVLGGREMQRANDSSSSAAEAWATPSAAATPSAVPTASPTAKPTATPTETPVSGELRVRPGRIHTFGDWQIRVTNAYVATEMPTDSDGYGSSYIKVDDGCIYFGIDLSIENLGEQSAQFLSTTQTEQERAMLLLANGDAYSTTYLPECGDMIEGATVNSQRTYNGELIFTIPRNVPYDEREDITLRIVKDGVSVIFELPRYVGSWIMLNDGENSFLPPDVPYVSQENSLITSQVYSYGEAVTLGHWTIQVQDIQTLMIPGEQMAHDYAVDISVTNSGGSTYLVGADTPGQGDLTFSLIRNQVNEYFPLRQRTSDGDFWDTAVASGEWVSGYARFTARDDIDSYLILKASCDGEDVFLSLMP